MKTLISIIILVTMFSCTDRTVSPSSIKGNWVYANLENQIYYAEIYVDESVIHVDDSYHGYKAVQYKLVDDSIFSFHPKTGEKLFGGTTDDNGDFQLLYIDNKITLKYRLEEQDDEYTLEKYVRDEKISNRDSLYALYLKDAGARQLKLFKKIMTPNQYEEYLNPPASHIDTSFNEVEPILLPK